MADVNKVKTYIGFAVRAGRITYGADAVIRSPLAVKVILTERTINRTSAKKLSATADTVKIPLITVEDGFISEATHKDNCRCIGITDVNLADGIINQYK